MNDLQILTATSRDLLAVLAPDHDAAGHSLETAAVEPGRLAIYCSCSDVVALTEAEVERRSGQRCARVVGRLKQLRRLGVQVYRGAGAAGAL